MNVMLLIEELELVYVTSDLNSEDTKYKILQTCLSRLTELTPNMDGIYDLVNKVKLINLTLNSFITKHKGEFNDLVDGVIKYNIYVSINLFNSLVSMNKGTMDYLKILVEYINKLNSNLIEPLPDFKPFKVKVKVEKTYSFISYH